MAFREKRAAEKRNMRLCTVDDVIKQKKGKAAAVQQSTVRM